MRTSWHTFRALPGWLRALLVGQFVNAAGALAWVFLTLYLVDNRHVTTAHAGLLTAANGAGLIAGNLAGGWVGDRIGLRRALLLGLFGWAAACALVPWTPLLVLGPLLFVAGMLGGFSRPLMSAVVLRALPAEQRRSGAALWRVAFNAGAIIGPPLGALAAGRYFGVIFVVDALSSLTLAAVILRFAHRDTDRREMRELGAGRRLLHVLRADRFAVAVLLSVIVVDTCYRQLYVGLPLQLHRMHAPTLVYGFTVTLNCVLIVVAEVWVAQRFAHRAPSAVIATGYIAVGLSWLVFAVHPAVVTAMALVVVISVGEMLYKPTATAAVADSAPPGFEGRFQSLYAGASISGTVFAPAIGGALFRSHAASLWLITGLTPLAAAAYMWAHRTATLPPPDRSVVPGATAVTGVESVGDLGGA